MHNPILKKALLFMVCAFGLYASSCKKENTAAPVIDSNFLKFTSSVPFNGTLSYVAKSPGMTGNQLENDRSRTVFADLQEEDAPFSPNGYYAGIFINGRFDPPQVKTPVTINLKPNANADWNCFVYLGFPAAVPNAGFWTPGSGTLTIVDIGNSRMKGYFNAVLVNDSLAGKTIELKNGTFNFHY